MKVSIVGSGFGERVMAPVYRQVGFEVVEVASPRDPEAVARAIAFAIEQPDDVEIGDIVIRPTRQG